MTSMITDGVRSAIMSDTYGHFTGKVGIVAILLLMVLLLQKELVRAAGGTRSRCSMQVVNSAIVPLSIAFVTMIVARFVIDILHYG